MSTSSTPTIVAYYRVSTAQQGTSGLGLESQRAAVLSKYPTARIIEFTEIESGRKNRRPILAAATAEAKKLGAVLVVAKLDRLARNVSFLFTLKEAGVNFAALDMPDLNTLTLGILATIAQHEAETISARTKAALKAKKARGEKVGTPENLTDDARKAGRAAHTANANANPNNIKARAMVASLTANGVSVRKIASQLNAHGFTTARGYQFTANTVQRLK